jgi:hypothetical protein
MKRANFKRSSETRQANAQARMYSHKTPTTDTGFCQNCANAPSPVRHSLVCHGEESPHKGDYVARKCSCAVFVARKTS